MSAPTILFVLGQLWSTVPTGVQGMVPVSWFDFVRCLLHSPLVPSERASPVGWLQSALVAPVGEERYVGFLRVPSRSRGVRVGSSVLGQAFRSEGPPGGGWCPKRVLRSERWAGEVEVWALVLLGRPPGRRPDCPPGPLFLRLLGRPMDYMLFSWAEPWRGSRSPRDPGFMNPTPRNRALNLSMGKLSCPKQGHHLL